jgi:uncharacterized protein (DUF58 family)
LQAALTNHASGYIPMLTILLITAVSLLQLLLVRRKISHDSVAADCECVRGEERKISVRIKNSSRLPAALVEAQLYISDMSGLDTQTLSVSLGLAAREERQFSFDADFRHIGIYRAGIKQMRIFDMLGVFSFSGEAGSSFNISVLPRDCHIAKLPVSTQQQTESPRAITVSPLSGMDYVGVREYAYGDPLKTIQWKLSAHSGLLMTKLTESYTATGITVVADTRVPGYTRETQLDMIDAIIETTAGIGKFAARGGMDCEILYTTKAGRRTRTALPALRDHLQEMCAVAAKPGEEITAHLLTEDGASMRTQSNIIILTSLLSDDMASAILNLGQKGKTAILYLFVPDSLSPAERMQALAPLRRLAYTGMAYSVCRDAQQAEG